MAECKEYIYRERETEDGIDGDKMGELVRCKDCFWYEIVQLKQDGTEDRRYKPSWCSLWREDMNEMDFCSYGKRDTDG